MKWVNCLFKNPSLQTYSVLFTFIIKHEKTIFPSDSKFNSLIKWTSSIICLKVATHCSKTLSPYHLFWLRDPEKSPVSKITGNHLLVFNLSTSIYLPAEINHPLADDTCGFFPSVFLFSETSSGSFCEWTTCLGFLWPSQLPSNCKEMDNTTRLHQKPRLLLLFRQETQETTPLWWTTGYLQLLFKKKKGSSH